MHKAPSGTNWEFEGFKVMTGRRQLIADGVLVPLTSKAFDTLVVLIENRDRVVTKDELLSAVWPDVEVEEGNLTQQIFLLRKALGESAQQPRHIATIPGHGYRFAALVTAISDDPVATTVSISGPASPTDPRRRMALTVTGLAVFGVIALLAVVLGPGWMPAEEAHVRADFTKHIAKVTESGKATFSAISRDGRYIAYIEDDGDGYSLWLKELGSEGKTRVVPRQPLQLAHVTFSPDGDYLYFTRQSTRSAVFVLYRIPTLGGVETPILEDVDTPLGFSPDGREFVFQRGAEPLSHIVVAPVGGGPERILATQRYPVRFSPIVDWSPDGKVVAAVVAGGSTSRTIVLIQLDNGSSRELYQVNSGIGRLRWVPDGSGLLAVIGEGLERRQFGRVSGGAIWRIEAPSGRAERLTSDLANHDSCCLDIGADGAVVANIVNTLVSDLWIAPADRLDERTQVTSDHPVVGRHSWLPDNDTVVYRDLTGRLNGVNKEGRPFILPLPEGEKSTGGVSACGNGRYVVFSTMPGKNIWRVTPGAGGLKKLTSGFNDFNPSCSPDGESVFYASRDKTADSPSLWRVSMEGGTPTPLNLVNSFDVVPSPSGRMIYYLTDDPEELRVGDRIPTTQSGTPLRLNRWVVISSSDQQRLFAIDAAGDPGIGVMTNWAPDESGLDYLVTRNGVSNIWRQPLTGGPPVQITRFSVGRIFSFAWSPDGRWLSFGTGAYRGDVVVMSSEP